MSSQTAGAELREPAANRAGAVSGIPRELCFPFNLQLAIIVTSLGRLCTMRLSMRASALVALSCALLVAAHEHHDELSEEEANAPVDAILWIHIFLQAAVWGILFPIGMVLGLSRSRWHVPLQVRFDVIEISSSAG